MVAHATFRHIAASRRWGMITTFWRGRTCSRCGTRAWIVEQYLLFKKERTRTHVEVPSLFRSANPEMKRNPND